MFSLSERTPERANSRASERPSERTRERANARASERPSERTPERVIRCIRVLGFFATEMDFADNSTNPFEYSVMAGN